MARGHLLAGFAGDPVSRVEHGTKLGEVRAEIGQHAGILGAFAREEKRERPLPAQGLLPVVEPAGIPDLPARGFSKPGLDCSQVRGQLVMRSGHDAQPSPPCRSRGSRIEREREVLERMASPTAQSVAQPSYKVSEADPIFGRQQKGLGIPLQERPGVIPSAEAACSSSTA